MTENVPLVSVIMPTFNRCDYIGEAISSVLSQTLENFELIIVDDGSTDSTRELVENIADPRIRYRYIEHKGRSFARNLALEEARGEYITFLDSDDLYLSNKLEVQVDRLETEKNCSCVYGAAYSIDREGKRVLGAYNRSDITKLFHGKVVEQYPYYNLPSGDIYRNVAFFIPLTILLPTVMFRRSVTEKVGPFDTTLDRFEDTDYWRRVSRTENWCAINEPLCEIRTHQGNVLTSQSARVISKHLSVYTNKILREDKTLLEGIGRKLSSDLYLFYASAFRACSLRECGLGHFSYMLFILKAIGYSPPNVLRYVVHKAYASSVIFKYLVDIAMFSMNQFKKRVLRPIIRKYRMLQSYRKAGKDEPMQEVFTDVFKENKWENTESRSGGGSDMVQTNTIRAELPRLLEKLNAKTMLDIPCGDFHWMKEVALNVDYTGADVVPGIVESNNSKYLRKDRRFLHLDLTRDRMAAYDVIFCRDVLVHLSFEDDFLALENIIRSNSKYLVTTTFTSRTENKDIATGWEWRTLNLVLAPFSFPAPMYLINENCTEGDGSWGDKCLGVWEIEELKKLPSLKGHMDVVTVAS